MNPLLMTLILAVGVGLFCISIGVQLLTLVKLKPEHRFDQWSLRIKRLLTMGLGQSRLVVERRERASGVMHVVIFWGFMILGLREIILIGTAYDLAFQEHLPLFNSSSIIGFVYAFLADLVELLVFIMIGYAFYRRWIVKPKRLTLSVEGMVILGMIWGVVLTDLLYTAAKYNLASIYGQPLHLLSNPQWGSEMAWTPVATALAHGLALAGEEVQFFVYQVCFWLHQLIIFSFLNLLPDSKHFHVITALPNVLLGSVGYPHTPATLLDLENEELWEKGELGAERIEHLSWKQGLDLYSCTECGRCYDSCPTYVTGKPLDLKMFNVALRDHLKRSRGQLLASGQTEQSLVGDVISEDTLWACTTCRACEEACPVSIEHVPRIIALRQGQTLMHDQYPKELNSTFKGLERNFNPWGIGHDQRQSWAEANDVEILTDAPTKPYDVLVWVGCMGSFDKRAQQVTLAMVKLLKQAQVQFCILGNKEKCTGDLARRTGNEMLYQTLASDNVATLNASGLKEIVTQCPHCLNALKNEYPQLDGKYVVYHHSQYIHKLIQDKRLNLKATDLGRVTFHDPCYLGRYNKEYDAPRQILASSSQQPLQEMPRCGPQSFCCGAGGGRMWMEENIGRRINEERIAEAQTVNPQTIATGCPFCMTMLEDGLNQKSIEDIQVRDIAEIACSALDEQSP